MAIRKIELGGGDIGLVELHRSLVLPDDIDLVLLGLRRDRVLGFEPLIAGEVHLGLGQRCLIVRELPLRLIERRLIGARIDQKQRLPCLYLIPLSKIDRHDPAVDPRSYVDRVLRLDRTQRGHDGRHILSFNLGCRHRNSRRRRRGGSAGRCEINELPANQSRRRNSKAKSDRPSSPQGSRLLLQRAPFDATISRNRGSAACPCGATGRALVEHLIRAVGASH